MKLIVSHLETSRTYVTREFYYIITDLMTTHGWKHIETNDLWNRAGTVRDKLLEAFGVLPKTILFWEAYEFLYAHATQIQRLNCDKFFLADDLHWWKEQTRQMKVVGFAVSDVILSTYAYGWRKFYPELKSKKVVWVPHSASPDFMLHYNHGAENSIFLSGAMNEAYPLRQQMMKLHLEGSYSIAYHRHPGYQSGYDYEANVNIGRGYAEQIHRYRVGFADSGSPFKYVVGKYFEIPATGALLLADDSVSGFLQELGFVENQHYLPASQENLEERIQYVLDERNHEELDQIRSTGQELVRERHKTSNRARQIDEVCSG
jgi:glycosyl transferase family 1